MRTARQQQHLTTYRSNMTSNTTTDSLDTSLTQVMLPCASCGHLVPEQNMTLHLLRACRGSTRSRDPLPVAQPVPETQLPHATTTTATATTTAMAHALESRRDSVNSSSGATAPVQDDWEPCRQWENPNRPPAPLAATDPSVAFLLAQPAAYTSASAAMDWSHSNDSGISAAVATAPVEDTNRRDSMDSNGVLQVGDIVDLVNSPSAELMRAATNFDDNDNNNPSQQWSCSHCTLLNAAGSSFCDACNHSRRQTAATASSTATSTNQYDNGVRAADPSRRDQLLPDNIYNAQDDPFLSYAATATATAQSNQSCPPREQQQQQQPASYMSSGALLGGVLGAAGAYMRGRPVGSAALNGAMSGAIGGAVLQEVMGSADNPTTRGDNRPNARSTSSRSNTASRSTSSRFNTARSVGADGSGVARGRGPATPQRVQVVRRRGPNGVIVSTVFTASPQGMRMTSRGGGGADHDPMMAFMQSMMSGPGAMQMAGNPNVDGMSYDQLLQAFGDGSENMGADEGDIRSMPCSTVSDPQKLPEDCQQCSICLEAFEQGDKRKTLPCLHGFHDKCIDKWLRTNGACPICKHRIRGAN